MGTDAFCTGGFQKQVEHILTDLTSLDYIPHCHLSSKVAIYCCNGRLSYFMRLANLQRPSSLTRPWLRSSDRRSVSCHQASMGCTLCCTSMPSSSCASPSMMGVGVSPLPISLPPVPCMEALAALFIGTNVSVPWPGIVGRAPEFVVCSALAAHGIPVADQPD